MNNQNQNIIELSANEFNLPLNKVQAIARQHDPRTQEFHIAVEELAYLETDSFIETNEIDLIFERLAEQRG